MLQSRSKLVKMLSECQTAWFQMRVRVTQRLILIQAILHMALLLWLASYLFRFFSFASVKLYINYVNFSGGKNIGSYSPFQLKRVSDEVNYFPCTLFFQLRYLNFHWQKCRNIFIFSWFFIIKLEKNQARTLMELTFWHQIEISMHSMMHCEQKHSDLRNSSRNLWFFKAMSKKI